MADEVKVFNVTLLVPPEKFGPLFEAIEHLDLEVEWKLVAAPKPLTIQMVERQADTAVKPQPKATKPKASEFAPATRAREIRDTVVKNLGGKTYTWGGIVDEFVRLDNRLTRKNLGHIIAEMVDDGMIQKLAAGRYAVPLRAPHRSQTAPAAKPPTADKKLPEGSAMTLLTAALRKIVPGTDITRAHLVKVVTKAGMTAAAFDVRRNELIQAGWLEQVGAGVYRRLQHESERFSDGVSTPAQPSVGTAPTTATTASNPTPLPDTIPGFSKSGEDG